MKSYDSCRLDQNGHLFTDKQTSSVVEIDGRLISDVSTAARCAMCSVWAEPFLDGDVLVARREPCPHPDGITSVVEIPVPSGVLVITDEIRPLYDGFGDHDYNTALGAYRTILGFADQGCAYGPTGNLSVGFYRAGADSYTITAAAETDADGNDIDPVPPESDRLAHVVCDLWAYSAVDRNDFRSKLALLEPEVAAEWMESVEEVQVRPGVYRFTHHSLERSFDSYAYGPVTFAQVEWVREVR